MEEQVKHHTVLDSDQQQVGVLYAKAILGAAGQAVDTVVADLEAVVKECLDKHPRLDAALASPRMSQDQKEKLLDNIFSGRIDQKLLNFLKILCRRGRISALRAIHQSAVEMRESQLGLMRVQVTSPQPLSDEQRSLIASRLEQAYGKKVSLVERTDANLLGGIVLRIGDKVLDGSILGKFDLIRSAVSSGVQKALRDRFSSLLTS